MFPSVKEKKGLKKVKEEFKELTKWWKDVIGGNTIASVKVSQWYILVVWLHSSTSYRVPLNMRVE